MRTLKLLFATLLLAGSFVVPVYAADEAADNALPVPCEVTADGEATCGADLELAEGVEASTLTAAEDKIPYVLFHLDSCPHCKDHIAFIESTLREQYGHRLDFQLFEISDPANAALYQQMAGERGQQAGGVPAAFIGENQLVLGYSSDDVTGAQILNIVEEQISGITSDNVVVPVLGEISAKSVSLPLLTLVLGLLDGFNPCAMWVLLFLISLLLPMKDPKRRWILGTVFILTSGISYFIFMAAWLQLILFIGVALVVRILIGALAISVGGISLRDFWRNRKADGVVCKVSDMGGAKKTFGKIKDIVHRESIWWSLLGITLLGFSINLVELACSAGFPALFTQILAIAEVTSLERYGYMAGYIFFYMLDDMIVFGAAMLTLKATGGAGNKYAKYAQLVSGLLMLILGLLLIFKPELLMFT